MIKVVWCQSKTRWINNEYSEIKFKNLYFNQYIPIYGWYGNLYRFSFYRCKKERNDFLNTFILKSIRFKFLKS